MHRRPSRPSSDIQNGANVITARWNSYFNAIEDALFGHKPLSNYATDAAAAAGGVLIGGLYHNAGAVRQRLT